VGVKGGSRHCLFDALIEGSQDGRRDPSTAGSASWRRLPAFLVESFRRVSIVALVVERKNGAMTEPCRVHGFVWATTSQGLGT
jgi:hypothetical protein